MTVRLISHLVLALSLVSAIDSSMRGNRQALLYEFAMLPMYGDYQIQAGTKAENADRNRYLDIIPFDSTRVVLHNGDNDYINANLLSNKPPSKAPHWEYIACQGPLKNTAEDFWQMVYEQESNIIIMLTRVKEGPFEKCYQYFPERANTHVSFGPYRVENRGQYEVDGEITARDLVLTQGSSKTRQVMHYQYHAWPDHGIVASTTSIRNLSRLLQNHQLTGPPIVHCSAGIGRTGTFCAIDIMRRTIDKAENRLEAEEAVDLKEIVSSLRRQRYGMVQTPAQYLLCYQALQDEIEEKFNTPQETPGSTDPKFDEL